MKVGYGDRENEAFTKQVKYALKNKSGWRKLAGDAKTYHSPKAHYQNIYLPAENGPILLKTVDDLYSEHAGRN